MAAPAAAEEERAAALTWGEQERRAKLGWWLWRCALLGTGQAGWCQDARWRERRWLCFYEAGKVVWLGYGIVNLVFSYLICPIKI
jgi:hypothetical protein